jgi:(5-formylfuran-3-yl)methyl phosphate synthase
MDLAASQARCASRGDDTMTQMLASVTSTAEALLALELGADIIDLKNPNDGALGALPLATIRDIVKVIDGRRVVSATIGDPSDDMSPVMQKIIATAATGVDIVKIGIATRRSQLASWQGMAWEPSSMRLVAVLFADQRPDFDFLDMLAELKFYGVMLDTADKSRGGLRNYLNANELQAFVADAHRLKLVCGLAGSLGRDDIAPLLRSNPDYLGFRGALCHRSSRTAWIDVEAFKAIRGRIPLSSFPRRRESSVFGFPTLDPRLRGDDERV